MGWCRTKGRANRHRNSDSGEGSGTRCRQLPHFSQRRREMGHPGTPGKPFDFAQGKLWGAGHSAG